MSPLDMAVFFAFIEAVVGPWDADFVGVLSGRGVVLPGASLQQPKGNKDLHIIHLTASKAKTRKKIVKQT